MQCFITHLSSTEVPRTIQEASKSSEWSKVVNEEMRVLKLNDTWEVVQKPMGKSPVKCKWVFTGKYNADGLVEQYKARLIAKGYTQARWMALYFTHSLIQ